jgi:ABC-type branched-subunit amino acid transport system substrate-binding protein
VTDDCWTALVPRRAFVRSLASVVALAALPLSADKQTVRIGIARRPAQKSFADGIALGLGEAGRAADLFGRSRIEVVGTDTTSDVARAIAKNLIRRRADVIIGALDSRAAREIAAECTSDKVIFMNCGARADSLRREICSRFVFHIDASDAMYVAAATSTHSSRIDLWSSSLEKYGAAQLNDRFRSQFGYAMDSSAWAGWIAVKIIWESMLRMGERSTLSEYLMADASQFDGHKGAPLSFRSWDHQLRQPLYAVDTGNRAPPRDIPDVSRSSGSIRDLLDSLSDRKSASRCVGSQ